MTIYTRLITRCLVVGLALWATVAMAQVQPNTIFQLDGNAAQTGGYPSCLYGGTCDYWNLLNGAGNAGVGIGVGSSAGHSQVRTFINGTASTDSFIGGGSKDFNPISKWAYSNHSTPDKDTLNAGYAAAYTQNNDFVVIFGADRFSPNGDANIGIWFFQNTVAPDGNGGFTGSHQAHDILVISAFTNGGGTSGVSVYEWEPACSASHYSTPTTAGQCADTNLAFLGSASAASVCTAGSPFCAITNASTTNSTWEGNIASPLFFEGGVDITYALLQAGITNLPCFSSFLVDTRSSQSTSAVLKDFLAGGFPVCSLSLTKKCGTASVNASGTLITYPVNGIVTNTGIGTLYNVQVFDTIAPSQTPGSGISVVNNTLVNSQPGPNFGTSTLGAGETGTWNDSSTSTTSPVNDSAIAKGSTDSTAGATQNITSTNTATASCSLSVNTSLSVTKSCTTSLAVSGSVVAVQVAYGGSVCNNGSSQVTGVGLTDAPASGTSGTISVGTLSPGQCKTYSGTYTPNNIDQVVGGGTGAGRYFWSDNITITSATATVGGLTQIKATDTPTPPAFCVGTYGCASASCPICQGSGECTP